MPEGRTGGEAKAHRSLAVRRRVGPSDGGHRPDRQPFGHAGMRGASDFRRIAGKPCNYAMLQERHTFCFHDGKPKEAHS